jgi:C-terminal binding protein
MALTVLEPECLYPNTALEQRILGADVRILRGTAQKSLLELPDELCAQADGLMTLRLAVPKEALDRFPRLKVVVRMGVGYDRVDRL